MILLKVVVALVISFLVFKLVLRKLAPVSRQPLPCELVFVNQATQRQNNFPNIMSSKASIAISIIIPAFNEQNRLQIMLTEALIHVKKMRLLYEFILVDDASRDDTIGVYERFAEKNGVEDKFRVIKLVKNRGKGGAVTQAMLVARGEYMLFVDADGATRFSDLDLLLNSAKRSIANAPILDGLAIAIGSRAHMVKSDAVVKRSMIRNFLMYSLHFILYVLGVRDIKDTQCGFKLVSREAAKLIFPAMHVQGWIFDIEMLVIAQNLGIPIEEVPVAWHEVEGSKVNLMTDSIKMLWDLILLRLCYAFGIWTYPSKMTCQVKKTKKVE